MNIEEIREYCLARPGVTEGFPFGQDVLVFKVMNKMFALTGLEGDLAAAEAPGRAVVTCIQLKLIVGSCSRGSVR